MIPRVTCGYIARKTDTQRTTMAPYPHANTSTRVSRGPGVCGMGIHAQNLTHIPIWGWRSCALLPYPRGYHTESEYCGVARMAYFEMTSIIKCLLLSLFKHTTVMNRSSAVKIFIFFWMKLPCSIFRTTDVATKKHEENYKKIDWCCSLCLGTRLAV